MKRYFNPYKLKSTLFLLLLLTCIAFKSNAQTIKVEATLDSVSIPMGAQTRLHLIAHVQPNDVITFPKLADSIGKIQIVSKAKPDTSYDKNNPQNETITQNYTVTSFTPGTYSIPPFTFSTKTGTFSTDTIVLQFKPVAVDTTKAIYDIKQPLNVTYTWLDWVRDGWPWIAVPIAIIAFIIWLFYYLKNRPKPALAVKAEPLAPPHVIALNKLNELRDNKIWQRDEVKLYHSELSDTLREYLEKRYHVHALEQTTDEIFTALKRTDISADSRDSLRQILILADLVKFAKEKPLPAENEQSVDNAISFIMQTRQEPQLPPANNNEELPK